MKVHDLRQCPKCAAVTDSVSHCFVKGPPMFPQLDDYTITDPTQVITIGDMLAWLEERSNRLGGYESEMVIAEFQEAVGL